MYSRRAVLRSGTGVAATGVAALSAGCSGIIGGADDDGEPSDDGGSRSNGDVGDPSGFAAWIPDHEAFVTAGSEVWFDAMDVSALVETGTFPQEEELRASVTTKWAGEIDPEAVSFGLVVGRVSVLGGSLDGEAVVDAFGLDPVEGYGEFDLYADESLLLAISEEQFLRRSLEADGYETGRTEVDAVIDAYEGSGDRLVDANEDFDRLADELDPGEIVVGSVTVDAGAVDGGPIAEAMAADVSADDAALRFVEVYESEDAIDVDEARAAFESGLEDDADGAVSDVDVSQNGRTIRFEAVTDTERFFEDW